MDWLHCRLFAAKISVYLHAPVAQLDRAFDYESKGRAFESLRVHHFQKTSCNLPFKIEGDYYQLACIT